MNRVEKEHLDAVAAMCAASDNSPLGVLLAKGDDVIAQVKAIITDGSIELPTQLQEDLEEQCNKIRVVMDSYKDLGARVTASNNKLNEYIARTMAGQASAAGVAADQMAKSAGAAETVTGGVK